MRNRLPRSFGCATKWNSNRVSADTAHKPRNNILLGVVDEVEISPCKTSPRTERLNEMNIRRIYFNTFWYFVFCLSLQGLASEKETDNFFELTKEV